MKIIEPSVELYKDKLMKQIAGMLLKEMKEYIPLFYEDITL